MQHNYRSLYLVTSDFDNGMKFFNYDTYHLKELLLTLKHHKIKIGKTLICGVPKFSGAEKYIPGFEIFKFTREDKIIDFIFSMGNNMRP